MPLTSWRICWGAKHRYNTGVIGGELKRIVDLLHERAGEDVVVLYIRPINPVIGDHFVIATGFTTDHLLDMAEEIVREFGGRIEGNDLSSWVVVDLGDIVVHLFLPDARAFYSLEDLYGDAEVLYSEREEVV